MLSTVEHRQNEPKEASRGSRGSREAGGEEESRGGRGSRAAGGERTNCPITLSSPASPAPPASPALLTTPVIATLEWLTETISPVEDENEQQPNVIEMAHSKNASSPIRETTTLVNNLLQGIDIEKLQRSPARKIAKALNIAQKINGKDAPVSWLRSQIKERLKEQPTQTAKVISSVLQKAG